MKNLEVAKKMDTGYSPARLARIDKAAKWAKKNAPMTEINVATGKHTRYANEKAWQKGRESLNSPKRGRDNEVASGKNEQEKS